MEISVRTRLEKVYEIKLDFNIIGMNAMSLPSFSVDRIREIVKPQVKALLLMNGSVKSESAAEELADVICYGTPLSQSSCQEGTSDNPDHHDESQHPCKEEDTETHEGE